ncbi:MAG: Hpt domain-containing protein [Pseudomonadota bacterium]|nr:Hpt domain-containing protein [Pseudomonadota bacterium]
MVTSQAGTHANGAVNTADLGPLAWVLDETRKSIESASRSLKRFAHEAEAARGVDLASVDASQLRMARQQLHQVVGALDMVGQSVAALMVRGMESAVQQFVQRPEQCSEDTANVLERAGFALVEYLQSQLADKPRSALGLFPHFKQVQELAGADRVHPADLWVFPWRWMDPATPAAAQRIAYGPEVRSRLDQRVLKIMKHADTNAAAEVSVISLGLADGESARQPVVFWKLSAGFFEALAQSLIPMDVYTKRAASRMLLQYATMARGDHGVSERLAQDLLFFCAQAGPVLDTQAPVLAAVRRAWGLEGHRAVSYEKATFGLYDPGVLAQARRRVEAIKENWSALAGGDMARAKACVDQFGLVTDSLVKLHAKGKPLADALSRVAEQTAHAGHPPSPELAMETATAVLFLEASFADFQPSDAMFTHRLNQLAQRLDVVREGGAAPALEPWMEELYRRVSDRQTMGTVIGELRTTLGEAEQHLDQFFRNSEDKQALGAVPGLLAQMKGVLSVLGLDQAALAVGRMRDTVDRLLLEEGQVDPAKTTETFEHLGNSLGALGFLVDMLDYQPVLARKLFVYDEEAGELKHVSGRVHVGMEGDAGDTPTALDIELDLGDESGNGQAAGQATMMPELSQPADMLTGQLEQMAKQAALDDKPALALAANRAADAARQDLASLPDALHALQAMVGVPAPAEMQDVPDGSAQNDAPDEDDDLLDIFLEEAREVVQNGHQAIQALALAPADMEQQTTLRRAFHTLKGSSRMVGLSEFGEAAWSMEQLLNAWLADPKPVNDDLRGLAEEAMQAFGHWVEDIAAKQAGRWQAAPFKLAADALRTQGTRVPLALDAGSAAVTETAESAPVPELSASIDMPLAAEAVNGLAEAPGLTAGLDVSVPLMADEPLAGLAFDDPAQEDAASQALDGLAVSENASEDMRAAPELVSPAGSLSGEDVLAAFDLPDLELTLPPTADDVPAEALDSEAQQVLTSDIAASAGDVTSPALPDALAEVPSTLAPPALEENSGDGLQAVEVSEASATDWGLPLALNELDFTAEQTPGTSVHAGSERLSEEQAPAQLAEPALETWALDASGQDAAAEPEAPALEVQEQEVPAATSWLADDDAYRQIGDLRVSTPLFNVYLSEADEWSRQLVADLADWATTLHQPVPERAIACAHSLAGSSATVGFAALSEMARAVEHALQRLHAQSGGTPEQARVLGRASEDMRHVLHQFAAGMLKEPSQALLAEVNGLEPLPSEATPVAPADEVAFAAPVPAPVTAIAPAQAAAAPATPGAARASITDDIDVADAVDPDLFPIFEEEAEELMPILSAAMREWISRPQVLEPRAQVLRALHTLKGSARLSGALRLGEVAHRIESAIETIGTEDLTPADLEPVQEHLDEMLAAFRRLQTGEVGMGVGVEVAPDAAERMQALAAAGGEAVADAAGQTVQAEPPAPAAQVVRGNVALPASLSMVSARAAATQAVRVRSQLLDRLVAQAGEVITSRARLEAGVGQLRSSLNDLTGNLERLRQQLRDVELQAETQMQSRLALSKDAQQNFDPLEFDRFTRMQELTRMMAESVNDVATVQRTLQRAVESSEDDLAAQARQSRELQRDLLRTRMVEFESISERLYRVVRQASKETGKQVRLDIVGGAIEMDRGILERMTPAFEHLLRNCVVHGIENQAMREARDKPVTGLITIEVQQAGNDVGVEFRDDGAGLNLPRIRERALQQGLITPEQQLSDAEVGNLIFAPGFTTATEVTELAGRGVGMDVVRTEVQALGGRIETSTREGRGSSFRLVLPLTTAVTHVVMVRAGSLAVGVPSNLVDIVQRATPQDLQQAYESGQWRMGDETLPFFWAGALLQNSPRSTEPPSRTMPVVIFRSAAQRVAVHVDEVLGNQEVVVKALGSQLSRLPGLVAITALASGAVALIYNPVALAAVYGEQARAMSVAEPQTTQADAPSVPTAAAAALHSDIPLVLVVDDSITVRRVTQRLLQREGYRVALAADGLQGLERLQIERPAVVLSDIEMPRMDGFDFVRNIRADEAMADLPVIMITSRIAEKHREHARELGVDHYLGKPYSEEELLGLIREYAKHKSVAD